MILDFLDRLCPPEAYGTTWSRKTSPIASAVDFSSAQLPSSSRTSPSTRLATSAHRATLLALEPSPPNDFRQHRASTDLVNATTLAEDKMSARVPQRVTNALNLLPTLKRTASQLIIVSAFLPRLSRLNRSPSRSSFTDLSQVSSTPLTLRQLFYTCKPLLQRSCAHLAPTSDLVAHTSPFTSTLQMDVKESNKSHATSHDAEENGHLPTYQASPAYVYDCVKRLASTLRCYRDHLLIGAEGHALFCARVVGATSSLPASLRSLLQLCAAVRTITPSVIDSFNSMAQAFLEECADGTSLQISIVAIEKEGFFEQILHHLDPHSLSNAMRCENLTKSVTFDDFEKFVMSHFQSSHGLYASRKQKSQPHLVFLVCSKGFPDQATTSLLRALHFFHTMVLLRTASHSRLVPGVSPFRAPPIRCFVDCNPSGVLIAVNLSPEGSPAIEWTGLLPSQLVELSGKQSKCQPLSKRDHAIIANLLLRAAPGSSIATELSLMQAMNVKAELQILFT